MARPDGEPSSACDAPPLAEAGWALDPAPSAGGGPISVERLCAAVLGAVQRMFGTTSSWLLLYDASDHTLHSATLTGQGSEAFRGLRFPRNAGVMGQAFMSRRSIFAPQASAEEPWFNAAHSHPGGLLSLVAIPLVFGDEVLGVLGISSPRFTVETPPTSADLAGFEAFAGQAAFAIESARLYEASERDRLRLRALLDERRKVRSRVLHLEQEVRAAGSYGEILGKSPALVEALRQATLVAEGDTTVLVLGETGTGKELLARFIHERSDRARGPFVAVNCAALPEALVESELFGHEKGAFTGAVMRKPGKFELANGGTLFLDELGDLPLPAQAKLLRVLQNSEIQRVGGTQAVDVDVRVIAATNQDLNVLIANHRFRSDLFYRVSVFPISLPPLRERIDDVMILARHFVGGYAAKLRRPAVELSGDALTRLRAYPWPGNVRELQNVIERAVILTSETVVRAAALGIPGVADGPARPEVTAMDPVATLADAERRAITAALDATNWRIAGQGGAAHLLGLRPTTLHAKMKRRGLRRPPSGKTASN